jgi:Uma2 family endonuclease
MAQPAQSQPGGLFVPYGRWTAQRALAELPEVAEVTIEVCDGSLVVSPRPSAQHQVALRELGYLLNRAARTAGLQALPEVNLVLGDDLAIPDITVVPRSTENRVWFDSAETVLVVEIMSPNHKHKDRIEMPHKYAQFGIRYYMRVEFRRDVPVIFLHELSDSNEYRPIVAAPAGTTFAMRDPFEFEIDPVELLDR